EQNESCSERCPRAYGLTRQRRALNDNGWNVELGRALWGKLRFQGIHLIEELLVRFLPYPGAILSERRQGIVGSGRRLKLLQRVKNPLPKIQSGRVPEPILKRRHDRSVVTGIPAPDLERIPRSAGGPELDGPCAVWIGEKLFRRAT